MRCPLVTAMKPHKNFRFFLPVILGIITGNSASAAAIPLPAEAALAPNTASDGGFAVRTVQASTNVVVGNALLRAIRQLNGTLTDTNGASISNVATAGPNAGGVYYLPTINFEKDALPFDIVDENGGFLGSFTPELFPGIPGTEGDFNQFATEAVALVELPAGVSRLGINVSGDRTDVNDDDGYSIFVGANPRDVSATRVADYTRVNAQPFASNQRIENIIEVDAPVAGVYPFRIVYWQTGRGANAQFYMIHPDVLERILINDPNDTRSPRAYRTSSDPRFNAPYVSEISPNPGSSGVAATEPVEIVMFDGAGATVSGESIQLTLNGAPATPLIKTNAGNMTIVRYVPDPARTAENNDLRLIYTDSTGTSHTNEWAFTILTSGGTANPVTGQWDFNAGNLAATVGRALAYLDPAFDGPSGSAENKTQFGTASSFGLPLINGKDAQVMQVPGDLDRKIGYVMQHGIAPNGGGTKVNQYTLLMDVYVDTSGPGAASLLQIDSSDNSNDGDLFWQGGNFGQGEGGYNGKGTFTAGSWHRVIAAYDLAANPPVVTKYVDGIKQDDWTTGQSLDAARRALLPAAVLFGDGDQDERRVMWVNSVQIRQGKLSDAQMAALGAPDGNDLPAQLPQSNVTGQWEFDYVPAGLSARVGRNLQYLDPTFDGPDGEAEFKTQFGLASELGVPLIGEEDAGVMQVPGDLDRRIGYLMTHLISPNGGGTKVNQYTLIMDVLVADSGPGAAALLQIDAPDNSNDGDLFWQGGNFGQGTDGYLGQGTFTAGEWHRVAAAYDMAANPPVVTKYVDGIFQHDWTAGQGLDAARRALLPTAVLFGDGDQDERRAMWVNSIQIRSGALSKAELEALGGPSASGIPIVIGAAPPTGQPSLTASMSGNQLTISWPAEVTGYGLETSPALGTGATWTPVTSANNSVTVTVGNGNAFYRLRQQ